MDFFYLDAKPQKLLLDPKIYRANIWKNKSKLCGTSAVVPVHGCRFLKFLQRTLPFFVLIILLAIIINDFMKKKKALEKILSLFVHLEWNRHWCKGVSSRIRVDCGCGTNLFQTVTPDSLTKTGGALLRQTFDQILNDLGSTFISAAVLRNSCFIAAISRTTNGNKCHRWGTLHWKITHKSPTSSV